MLSDYGFLNLGVNEIMYNFSAWVNMKCNCEMPLWAHREQELDHMVLPDFQHTSLSCT